MRLASLIHSTGLRRAALMIDLQAALNRYELTANDRELDLLTREQLALLLRRSKQVPGEPFWRQVEARIGTTLTPDD